MGQFHFVTGTTYHTANESGSPGWVAYECIDWDGLNSDDMHKPSGTQLKLRWKEKLDIQVAGMLSFYILTKGKHPFGPKIDQLKNLQDGNPVGLSKLSDPVVEDLLSQMLAKEVDKRPYAEQALKHPYFLSLEDQLKFVVTVGNEFEKNGYSDVHLQLDPPEQLDPPKQPDPPEQFDPPKPRSLLPNDWKKVIGPDDLKTLCTGGNYQPSDLDGTRYTQCIRLIRNAFVHMRGKLHLNIRATSLEEYFHKLFPTLPLVLHQIIRKHSTWKTHPAFKEFFPVINHRPVSDAD
jgi:serine/threonine protein kinase